MVVRIMVRMMMLLEYVIRIGTNQIYQNFITFLPKTNDLPKGS